MWVSKSFRPVTGLLIGLVLLVTAIFTLGDGGHTTSAESWLQTIPDSLKVQEGDVLHKRVDVFTRYGSLSDVIAEQTGIPTEKHTRESWMEIGPDQSVVRAYATLRDANGIMIQESRFENDSISVVDPRTSEVVYEDETGGQQKLNGAANRARQYRDMLASGKATVLSQSANEIMLEVVEPLPDAWADYGDEEYSVPFVGDLNATSLIKREAILSNGSVSISELHAILANGTEVLLSSEHLTVYEILQDFPEN